MSKYANGQATSFSAKKVRVRLPSWIRSNNGSVAEWIKALVLKTSRCNSLVGSNPTASSPPLNGAPVFLVSGSKTRGNAGVVKW